MGAHEGMAGEARGTLESGGRVSASSVSVQRAQPSIGELLPGCNTEIRCRVAILGWAFFLNDSFFFYLLRLWFLLLSFEKRLCIAPFDFMNNDPS